MSVDQTLVAELETALASGSKDRRVETLRRITDLFVGDADRLNDRQIAVFDDVLGHLMKRMEEKALAELSRRLGPIGNAPVEVVRRLARHDDINVAEPILTQSPRLADKDLLEIAGTKSQAHLLAISGRLQIGSEVTDILLQRGDSQVVHRLAGNSGARFSESGFDELVKRSERDERLAEKVGLRLDVPSHFFSRLLSRATASMRSHLLALAGPDSRNRIQRVLAQLTDGRAEPGSQDAKDGVEAYERALAMRSRGELGEAALREAAKADRANDMMAMLAVLSAAPFSLIQSLCRNEDRDAFLTPCKAAGLDWSTVRSMMASRALARKLSEQDIELAHADYARMSQASAQRVLRFWQFRRTTPSDGASTAAPAPIGAAQVKLRPVAER